MVFFTTGMHHLQIVHSVIQLGVDGIIERSDLREGLLQMPDDGHGFRPVFGYHQNDHKSSCGGVSDDQVAQVSFMGSQIIESEVTQHGISPHCQAYLVGRAGCR